MIEHVQVRAGEGFIQTARRLAPGVGDQDAFKFAQAIAVTSGLPLSAKLYTGQVLHVDTDTYPTVTVPPPVKSVKVLGGYLESWGGLPVPADIPDAYNVLFHAFGSVGADGTVNLHQPGSTTARAAMIATYKARQAAGKPVLLSLGGSGGAANGLQTVAAQDRAIASLTTIIETWGFSGIDWDLESSSPPDPVGCARVSRELRKRFGPEFMITMAPFSLVTAQYRQLATLLQQSGDLTWVGFQFYNRETVTAATIIGEMEAWMTACKIRPDQFVVGFWRGPWDWHTSGTNRYIHEPANMADLYTQVEAKYPTVRGVFTWGIRQTEIPNGYPFAKALAPVVL